MPGFTARLGVRLGLLSFMLFSIAVGGARGEEAPGAVSDRMLLVDRESIRVRAHFEAGVNLVGERNLYWRLSDRFAASAQFNPTRSWWEFYAKPGLSFEATMSPSTILYGGVSVVASGTLSRDAFDTGDTGRISLEESYLGLRYRPAGSVWSADISAGRQEYRLGTGMLIANGGSNGFERGALKLGPRMAWGMTAIARVNYDKASAEFFYLDANELPNSDNDNRVVGASLRYDPRPNEFIGLAIGHVPTSRSPYVQVPPGAIGLPRILPGAREKMSFLYAYSRLKPLPGRLSELWVGGDFAYEWNDRVDMRAWAGGVEIGHEFADLPWRPTLSYSFRTFSGDDPTTSRLERFDPLFYDGGLRAWASGSKSAMLFINSNVRAHTIALGLTATPRDLLSIRYSRLFANELRSPVQFGQATRLDTIDGMPSLVTGVTARHLADDVFVEYTRVLSSHAFLTLGGSMSKPAAGIQRAAPGLTRVWSGAFANLVMRW